MRGTVGVGDLRANADRVIKGVSALAELCEGREPGKTVGGQPGVAKLRLPLGEPGPGDVAEPPVDWDRGWNLCVQRGLDPLGAHVLAERCRQLTRTSLHLRS